MRKVIASLMIATTIIFSATGVSACDAPTMDAVNPSDIVIVSEIVKDVIYEDGWFYLITTDIEGGKWVLDVCQYDGESPSIFEDSLELELVGKTVDIQFIHDHELLSWYPSN